ncbi:50S ribosomal protein L15 [Gemmatimonadota bacterium]
MGRYEINPSVGSRQTRKRIGRGTGSGTGKTAGKGHKGQKARSGYSQRAWFEGGQMPLQRRVPKRGFKNPFRTTYDIVNVGDLERVKTEQIDKEALKDAGLIRSANGLVKVLGNGKLDKSVNVTVDAFSASARTAIEAAGGSCTVIQTDRRDFRAKRTPEAN